MKLFDHGYQNVKNSKNSHQNAEIYYSHENSVKISWTTKNNIKKPNNEKDFDQLHFIQPLIGLIKHHKRNFIFSKSHF